MLGREKYKRGKKKCKNEILNLKKFSTQLLFFHYLFVLLKAPKKLSLSLPDLKPREKPRSISLTSYPEKKLFRYL